MEKLRKIIFANEQVLPIVWPTTQEKLKNKIDDMKTRLEDIIFNDRAEIQNNSCLMCKSTWELNDRTCKYCSWKWRLIQSKH